MSTAYATPVAAPTPAVVVVHTTTTTVNTAPQVDPPVAGAALIMIISVLLIVAGFAELISGAIVTSDSGGFYVGGVYVGILCMIAGIRGCMVKQGESSLISIIICAAISGIIAIVGSALQSSMYNFLESLEACASTSDSLSTSCGNVTPVYYTCDGDSSSYAVALGCAVANYDGSGDQCSCVTTSDSTATCYNYNNYDNCSNFLNEVPHQLQVSYAFSVICTLLSAALILVATISMTKPQMLGGVPKTSNGQLNEQLNQPQAATYNPSYGR